MGGAFDPPHLGHVTLARVAVRQLELDELRIIPTGRAWHKPRALSDASHRLAMAGLAFAEIACAHVDPRETLREGASYTVDTLRELRSEFPTAQLFLVLGEDQAKALPSWHRWEEIPQLAIICVAARADLARTGKAFNASFLAIPGLRLLEMPAVPMSSTDIRHRVATHQNVSPLVFEPVARYIEQHHLYCTA